MAKKTKKKIAARAIKATPKLVSRAASKQATVARPTLIEKFKQQIKEVNPLSETATARLQLIFASRAVRWFIAPMLLYLVLFYFFQPHYFGKFSDAFYLDTGDGYQNVWNIWWVNQSIVNEQISPYFTNLLQYPHGTTLIPQTMNIFNGLMAIPLMNLFGFSLIEAVNFAVTFSFVVGGLTMFWFIQKLYGKYWVSLVAGGLFTFSSYHFAHGLGHLQLISFEWIPLFLLAFWTMLEKLRYRDAAFAAVALFLVLLCDYYYLMWSVFLGAGWLGWKIARKEVAINWHLAKVLGVFGGLCLALVGPLMYQLWKLSKDEKLLGSHDASVFSLDPISVILPGGSWYWGSLTADYWTKLPYASETSVYFGFGLIVTVILAIVLRKKLNAPSWLPFWWIVMVVFGVLALGPRLKTLGERTIDSVPLPYAGLVEIMPSLKMSGMPIRWVLISLIAAIIIASFVLSRITFNNKKGYLLASLFILVAFVDLFPFRLPLSYPKNYEYVQFLKELPRSGVIDNAALTGGEQLFNQTQHGQPMAFGYVTRITKEADEKNFHIFADLEEGRYADLCKKAKIRYVTLPPNRPLKTTEYPIIYRDKNAIIYDMKNGGGC